MPIQADLRQAIYALSDSLDLVGVDDVAHGKRVGVMAAECARGIGWPDAEVQFAFDLGLLHDIGVSSTAMHQHLVREFDWAGSQGHAEAGHALLCDFAPLARMALPIRYHHVRWDAMQAHAVPPEIATLANLVFLADRVDAVAGQYHGAGRALRHRALIQQEIAARAGSYFDPRWVEVFLSVSAHEAFWLQLESRGLHGYLRAMQSIAEPYQASNGEFRALAEIFARIVDAKSPFTVTHSRGVARVARRLAEHLGLPAGRCDELEIAGLLHDLGKLRVPDGILDKAGRLDDEERTVMRSHSFESWQILRQIRGFEDIAAWAAHHHEAPGGAGYPFGVDAATLPLEARILRVADIFQAMVQDRPYRPGLSPQAVAEFMARQRDDGQVDASVVAQLLLRLPELYPIARLED
ncbi:MAG: HD domain-containing protein [Rhodanobacteraceae bacterium]|nr:HD domain-containing protein [Rhodanobacteraceae bacterium]